MALVVVRPGVGTTVQDRGRVGHRRFGVPVGGAFDLGSFELANALLGNPPDAAALELTLVGGSYRAEIDLAVALAGAAMTATVESKVSGSRRWSIPRTGTLQAGETLILGGTKLGARTYLAVRGGWRTPVVLGSRSTEQPLRAGDRLSAAPGTTSTRRPTPALVAAFGPGPLHPGDDHSIRWVAGPDLPPDQDRDWLPGVYLVADQANRVGLRFSTAAPIDLPSDPSRLSRPVAPGAIQVAGGAPIILGVAGGTLGGYPHLGHVIAADLDRVGQLGPGHAVRFERVGLAEARRLDTARRQVQARWRARLLVWAGV